MRGYGTGGHLPRSRRVRAVRFASESGHARPVSTCPLCAICYLAHRSKRHLTRLLRRRWRAGRTGSQRNGLRHGAAPLRMPRACRRRPRSRMPAISGDYLVRASAVHPIKSGRQALGADETSTPSEGNVVLYRSCLIREINWS